jgi:hypothetical protein
VQRLRFLLFVQVTERCAQIGLLHYLHSRTLTVYWGKRCLTSVFVVVQQGWRTLQRTHLGLNPLLRRVKIGGLEAEWVRFMHV